VSVHVLPTASGPRLRTAGDLVDTLGIDFSDQQLAAITAPLEPGVIIAGAGSGKTTVMAARVVWLVGTGAVRPEEVLGLTFTRKAAAELSQRVRNALLRAGVVTDRGPDESGEQLIMTYDAFAGRVVAEHGLRLGFEADPTMISGATRFRLASQVVNAAAGPFEFISRLRPATVTERVLKLDADLQQHLVDAGELDKHTRDFLIGCDSAPHNNRGNPYVEVRRAAVAAQERLELASLVQDYQSLKQRLGLVEFADQMAIAARLASEIPEVSRTLRATFRVVLLDEYQDTSAAQALMLRGLFSGVTPDDGLGHPVTAVGDPFQAIYGWRGAAASNILRFAVDFRRSDGQPSRRLALTINRRSGQSILDVANALSQPLRKSMPITGMAAEREGPRESRPDGDHGLLVRPEPELDGLGLLRAPAGTGPGEVRAATFDTWPEEVSWIADQILAAKTTALVHRWADIAVLTRRNADIAPLYSELTGRDVPVEIVGLGGLLLLPEIMDVTATLRLVHDVTANPDLIRLLTGPRWRIGPRDLALLGSRARELAREGADGGGSKLAVDASILAALETAVAEVDPTEVVSLLDALESPGERPYSAAALDRFARFAAELSYLRQHGDEPVLDLTRRVIATLGLEVELMATREFARTSRRDQLGTFLDAVAAYADVDGDASLAGLLAYLQAEIDQGAGLDQAVPSDREAVKLLTVHKAKGLEWDLVFLPALMKGVFPSDRVTDNWVSNPAVLPADLRGDAAAIPQLAEVTNAAMTEFKARLSEQQGLAEDRMAYDGATRARRVLVGSGHVWRADLVRPRTPSAYLQAIADEADRQGLLLAEAAPPAPQNPMVAAADPYPWPSPLDPDGLARRQDAAREVADARRRHVETGSYERPDSAQILLDEAEIVAGWDADIDRLLTEAAEARTGVQQVQLPTELSASALLRLEADPETFTADLARPMPRPPSRATRLGTRFHHWVEQHVRGLSAAGALALPLVDPEATGELDAGEAEVEDEAALRELCQRFAGGMFGSRVPVAVEAPFTVLLGGRLVRGRIDAVYPDPGRAGHYQVVDWKTSGAEYANPLQLAIYRLAWAELRDVPIDSVDAAFYDVRRDRLVHPDGLAGRPELERLLSGPASPPSSGVPAS
jgi:DNA helicase II / ATP-dependent DNA helicase PcrA